ncbi:MAG: hypothetical protein IPH82_04365 [Chloroflexi bacterium]|nr:hypothetical protein [Chloroflexota bacterium]
MVTFVHASFQQTEANRFGHFRVVGRTLPTLFLGAASAVTWQKSTTCFLSQCGSVAFKSGWYAALLALSPRISEEIIFDILSLLFATSLQATSKARSGYSAILILAVVPHSLNHL